MTWWPLRQGPADREPRRVSESLEGTARRLGAPSVGVLGVVFGRWEELVGPDVAAHARPRALRGGVLTIEVDEPAWATQLRYLAHELLRRVEEAAGPAAVREVRVQVAPGPAGAGPGPASRRRRDTPLW